MIRSVVLYLFFFFKQKTAYEMVSCDWSSDVCSSDLWPRRRKADRPSLQKPGLPARGALGRAARRALTTPHDRHVFAAPDAGGILLLAALDAARSGPPGAQRRAERRRGCERPGDAARARRARLSGHRAEAERDPRAASAAAARRPGA